MKIKSWNNFTYNYIHIIQQPLLSISKIFIIQNRNPTLTKQQLPILSSPKPLVTSSLRFIITNLLTLNNISDIQYLSFVSRLFIQHNIFNVMNQNSFLLWLNTILLILHHILFIHLSINGHMDCFHFLLTIANAPVISSIQLSVSVFDILGYVSGSGIAASYSKYINK